MPSYDWATWKGSPPDVAPSDYTDNGDGTVTDNVTGLLWQQATVANTFTWDASDAPLSAQAYCAGLSLGGHSSGWRLPSFIELFSVTNLDGSKPAIDAKAFPGTVNSMYWAATPYTYQPGSAWVAYFDNGVAEGYPTTNAGDVRCVWSQYAYEQWTSSQSPAGRYTYPDGSVDSSQTVHDTVTGLTWQRGAAPGTANVPDAEQYCAGLKLGGLESGWRLPTVKELLSVVDFGVSQPAVDQTAFPNFDPAIYWASTPFPNSNGGYWGVDFYDGSPAGPIVWATGTADVRCVHPLQQ